MSHDWIRSFAKRRDLPDDALGELRELVDRELARSAPTIAPPPHEPKVAPQPTSEVLIGDRYRDLGPIAEGGMGEVRRVYDERLQRTLAMKLLHRSGVPDPGRALRFVAEAQATAQLQHPGIVPVHDFGTLPDGRAWFTMREIDGPTLGQAIDAHHADNAVSRWTLRRLVAVFGTVCDTVAYAHERGVVHRDLKPPNVIVGAHGEVLVLDWGLFKVVGATEGAASVTTDWSRVGGTVTGAVTGTPAYMPPEQARGEIARLDARSDVYALGAMLYHLLAGRPPYVGSKRAAYAALLAGPPADVAGVAQRPVPAELAHICGRAMARDPDDRYDGAAAVAAEIEAWLDGARRREQALDRVRRAATVAAEAEVLQRRAAVLQDAGDRVLAELEEWQPETDKARAWALQDEAAAVTRQTALKQLEADQELHAALKYMPGLPEAHTALLQGALARHAVAEQARDGDAVALAEEVARTHAEALPSGHPDRLRCATVLEGDGALTLVTDPPGAEVVLHRYVQHNRRLVAERVGSLGRTPLVAVSLPMGRYLAVLRHAERAPVRYPFEVARSAHWDGVPPGESAPLPVRLPRPEDLAPDDVVVPAGWMWSGGDPDASGGLPGRRLWCHALVIERNPVTNARFIAFLDAMVARGDAAAVDLLAPRPNGKSLDQLGAHVYERDAQGRFQLPAGEERYWRPTSPVTLIDWHAAVAFAAWQAEQTGRPWRLPGEFEWEHAARGADARLWPWGDHFDPSWCACRNGHPGPATIGLVTDHPVDESPYGVRGMAGNMRDFCGDLWSERGPPVVDGRVGLPPPPDDSDRMRPGRGGGWSDNVANRCAFRIRHEPRARNPFLGFRLARSLEP